MDNFYVSPAKSFVVMSVLDFFDPNREIQRSTLMLRAPIIKTMEKDGWQLAPQGQ
jgi:hypothetical protein